MYAKYFNIKFPERDESWDPLKICPACNLMLYNREESENNASLKFIVPAIWENPQNERNCYFFMNDVKKWRICNKISITNNAVSLVIGPQIKKPVDIPVNAGTSHSNTIKMKAEHGTDYFRSSSEDYNIET